MITSGLDRNTRAKKICNNGIVESLRRLTKRRLQNSRIFCVGLSNECARSLNERSGASVKTALRALQPAI